jgi:LPXTG-site transpeptidase (sortase) family protein
MRRAGFYIASAICGASLLLFAVVLVHAVGVPDVISDIGGQSASVPAVIATTSLPVRLTIPALDIDAHIQYVGVTAKGAMGVPSNFTDVAWYKDGTVPGNSGNAVIDGHVDNGLSLAGVFKHLSDIHIGDSVDVQTKDGSTVHFIVYDIENYPYMAVPVDRIFAQTSDAAYLNLITCEGAWVGGQRTYDHRLVVYAKRVGS